MFGYCWDETQDVWGETYEQEMYDSDDSFDHSSPLEDAIQYGHEFSALLNKASEAEIKSAVWDAIEYQHIEALTAFLTEPILSMVDLNSLNSRGNTLLMEAVRSDWTPAVKVICDVDGVDVNLECNGNSALRLASRKGFAEVVGVLLSTGKINVNAADKYGRTALHKARNEQIKALIVKVTGENLPRAVRADELERVIDAQEAEFYNLERAMQEHKAKCASVRKSMRATIDSLTLQLRTVRKQYKSVLTSALDQVETLDQKLLPTRADYRLWDSCDEPCFSLDPDLF